LIGLSKTSWLAGLQNWVNISSAPICVDESPYPIWNGWGASQRDLFITNPQGEIIFEDNITPGIPENITDIILSNLSIQNNFSPNIFNLEQNYPNPFNGSTLISYSLPTSETVNIKIFDLHGKLVKTLYNDFHSKGSFKILWHGKDDQSKLVSSGIYFYTIIAGQNIITKKLSFLK
tara:strand:- start:570 stop:1097 length:528 start_codon:yes stop_codon:yes gene_type:complete